MNIDNNSTTLIDNLDNTNKELAQTLKDTSNENEVNIDSDKHEKALAEFQKLLQDSSDEEVEDPYKEKKYFSDDEVVSQVVESEDFSSAVAGTSKNSSNSFRNLNQLVKIPSPAPSVEEKLRKKSVIFENSAATLIGNESDLDLDEYSNTEDYELDKINLADTLTLIEEEDDQHGEDGHLKTKNLKKAAVTILLTHKWRQKHKILSGRKRKQKVPIKYQATYRMEPTINVNSIKYLIVKKTKQTFESLVEKHGKYDTEYTPKFLRIITEMIKNDVKTFKLDRYKIVVHVTILKKVFHQSIQFISRELFNIDDDHKIALRADTKSFFAVCLIFLVYNE